MRNIKLNNEYLQNKIHLYNLGLGAENTEIEALYIPNRDAFQLQILSGSNRTHPMLYQSQRKPNAKWLNLQYF